MADGTHAEPAPAQERDRPARSEGLPGIRLVIAGAVLAVLAPLFGFLGGSMVGSQGDATVQPLFLWMLGGIVIGGLGTLIVIVGGLRLMGARRQGGDREERARH